MKIKKRVEDLAIFGGQKAFADALHVGRPNIGNADRLRARVDEVLQRRWLTNDGPMVREFEAQIIGLTGVKHCVAVCNATVGLEIATAALGLQGEVIVPSMTFVATAHALRWRQVRPVFADIDPKTHNLDPAQVEAMITPQTTGIVGVHLWGRPCAIPELTAIARRRQLKLLFDAAHAFACSYDHEMIGNFGDAEVFSFHATKFCNALEGGAIVTNDDAVARRARLMRNFGFVGLDQVESVGTNGKMNELSAAMGLTSLESMHHFVHANHNRYSHYRQELAGVSGISLMRYDETACNNYQYIVLEVDEAVAGITRDQLIAVLTAENVLARRYFYPGCHRMEPYCTEDPEARLWLPQTEWLLERVICLPTGTAVTLHDISTICCLIRLAVSKADVIRVRLEGRQPPALPSRHWLLTPDVQARLGMINR
jgi:dTDP-4-amino-4,6-dideoxygalactose transaminase